MADKPLGINGLNRGNNKPAEPQCTADKNTFTNGHKPSQMSQRPLEDFFTQFASQSSEIAGRAVAFGAAVCLIILWLCTGPFFHFSDTWQLVVNTGTTIITFLMVFLIQNTQNRDSQALHLKIDALLLTNPHAQNMLVRLEDLSQDELQTIKKALTGFAGDKEQVIEALKQADQTRLVTPETEETQNAPGETKTLASPIPSSN